MNEKEIEIITGQISALSMVLTAVIEQMEKLPAARCAASLAIANLERDQDPECPDAEARTRNSVVNAYLDLLSIAAKRA